MPIIKNVQGYAIAGGREPLVGKVRILGNVNPPEHGWTCEQGIVLYDINDGEVYIIDVIHKQAVDVTAYHIGPTYSCEENGPVSELPTQFILGKFVKEWKEELPDELTQLVLSDKWTAI